MRGLPGTVSVVLPVHAGAAPAHVREALLSILDQTRPAEELVIVEDGPLPPEHRAVLDEMVGRAGATRPVRVVLETNSGAGVANQAGLEAATGEWIAKADADDVCDPRRFERQLAEVVGTGADVCGSAMDEFEDGTDPVAGGPTRRRTNPLSHEDIVRRMRWNNPVNHPTAFYRRELALRVGGYSGMRFMQDYDLFARMLAGGAVMRNLPEPLVRFRSGEAMRRRRRGREILSLEWTLQRRLRGYGIIGPVRMWVNLVARTAFRLLPSGPIRLAYRHLLSTAAPARERSQT